MKLKEIHVVKARKQLLTTHMWSTSPQGQQHSRKIGETQYVKGVCSFTACRTVCRKVGTGVYFRFSIPSKLKVMHVVAQSRKFYFFLT